MKNTPYKNLPSLVGLATFEAAAKPGLSIEECVKRLKRFHYSLWRLHQICIAHIATEKVYELKMAFSLHGHITAVLMFDQSYESKHPDLKQLAP